VLERVTYANDENAWSVVKLVVPGKRDLVTAVGNLLGVQPGESLRVLAPSNRAAILSLDAVLA